MAGNLTAMIASIFSGSAVTPDPYYEYTTLLLPGSGTNGAQNNTFLDGSTNNFTITRNGNTTQGTFSPFSQTGWGNYFDGTGDYLTVASNSTFAFGTGDFAIAFWIYPTQAFLATGSAPVSMAYNTGFNISIDNVELSFWIAGTRIQSSTRPTPNQWNYVVCTRQSGTAYVYINGTQTATGSLTGSVTNSQIYIGTASHNVAAETVVGYLSDVQILGSYLAATVPTSRATSGANTKLLTCQSNRFIDNSTNNFTITRNGDTRVVAFSPFNPTASWSAATYGGSGYFDGSGDYLQSANSTAFNLGTNNFTIELWFYTSSTSNQSLISAWNTTSFEIIYFSGTLYCQSNATAPRLTTTSWPLNQWNHIAYVRSGSTYSAYLNGTRFATATDSASIPNVSSGPTIGARQDGTITFNGYISNARIVNGTAVYDPTQTTITVPTAPLTAITNTSLLLNFTNAGIYDATSKNDLETVGNAQISNTTAKFGSTSIKFDGTGDWLTTPASTFWQFGTGDFTIEFWWYAGSLATYQQIISVTNDASISGTGEFVITYNTTLGLRFYINAGATIISQGSTSGWTTGQWYYIAAVRSGNTLTLYRDGSSIASGSVSGVTIGANVPFHIGGEPYTPVSINGYIQDLRVTTGYARPITTPTAAFPTF